MLSIEDRFAIQDLYARYCAYVDTYDIERWADTFTEDAVLDSYQRHDGRAAIAAYGRILVEKRDTKPWVSRQHWTNNLVVEGDDKTASALCYLVVVGKSKATGEFAVFTQGTYQDDLVKAGGAWKFKRRKLNYEALGPEVIPQKR